MFDRYFDRYNDHGSKAAACESASCCSRDMYDAALLLTLDTVLAVSIFAALELIIIRLLGIISILSGSIPIRPLWLTAQ